MKKETEKTPRGFGFGALKTDAGAIDQFMKDLGVTEAWLAEKTGLSQQYINRLRNGKQKNASPAASDRIINALQGAWEAKKAADKPRLTPEAAARIREKAAKLLNEAEGRIRERAKARLAEPPTENEHMYGAFIDLQGEVDPDGLLTAQEALVALGGPPRHPGAYQDWKAKQIEVHTAAKELPSAKNWIKILEKQRSELQKQISLLEQINSKNDEVVSLYQGLVERLKKQLIAAGLEPAE